jgi:hypothetical protein
MSTNSPRIEIQLHPDGVAAPTHAAALTCREIIDFYFDALTRADLSKKPSAPEGQFFRLDFGGSELSASERRAVHENWILSKAFQELMRGVRASLEEAFFFTELIAAGTIRAQSSGTLEDIFAPFRKRAADLKFPPLLAQVNQRADHDGAHRIHAGLEPSRRARVQSRSQRYTLGKTEAEAGTVKSVIGWFAAR